MAGARLEIYDTAVVTILDTINAGDVPSGTTSAVFSLKIRNIGTGTATSIRIGVRTNNGVYTDQSLANGQEAVTETWVQIDKGSGYSARGGDFGNQGVLANYETHTDLAAGAVSSTINFKAVIPDPIDSNGNTRVSLVASYGGY